MIWIRLWKSTLQEKNAGPTGVDKPIRDARRTRFLPGWGQAKLSGPKATGACFPRNLMPKRSRIRDLSTASNAQQGSDANFYYVAGYGHQRRNLLVRRSNCRLNCRHPDFPLAAEVRSAKRAKLVKVLEAFSCGPMWQLC
jgi:hypothetical protein